MRFIILIALLIIVGACSVDSDRVILLNYYQENNTTESLIQDSIENSIARYDDLGYVLDKHWFDENDELDLYTFYNRFHETDKAVLRVRFDVKNNISDFDGEPFYVATNLNNNDTLLIDTVKAYIYLANSPFLSPEIKIQTKNISNRKEYLVQDEKPNYVVYFEDYPDSLLQKMEYKFCYTLSDTDLPYTDSLIYNVNVKREPL